MDYENFKEQLVENLKESLYERGVEDVQMREAHVDKLNGGYDAVTERITMNGRPPEPKYARNKNVLVVGGSGSGKTRFFIKPNALQMNSSLVITDPMAFD